MPGFLEGTSLRRAAPRGESRFLRPPKSLLTRTREERARRPLRFVFLGPALFASALVLPHLGLLPGDCRLIVEFCWLTSMTCPLRAVFLGLYSRVLTT